MAEISYSTEYTLPHAPHLTDVARAVSLSRLSGSVHAMSVLSQCGHWRDGSGSSIDTGKGMGGSIVKICDIAGKLVAQRCNTLV